MDSLVDGPRGRRMLYELACATDEGLRDVAWDVEHGFRAPGASLYVSWAGHGGSETVPRRARAETSAEVAERIATRSPGYAIGPGAVTEALAASVAAARAWQEPDATDLMLADPAFEAALEPLAERVAGMQEAEWWREPAAAEQCVTRFFYEDRETREIQTPSVPDPGGTRQQLSRWRADGLETERRFGEHAELYPGAALSGAWWSLPLYTAVWTTPELGTSGPAALRLEEDRTGETRARVWHARALAGARVLEIAGPEDWAELCRRHPFDVTRSGRHVWREATGRDGRWTIPDWPAVAEDWDAVHVSVAAYLQTAQRALPVADDAATVLAGWGPGATVWLTDALELDGDAVDWVYDGDRGAWTRLGS